MNHTKHKSNSSFLLAKGISWRGWLAVAVHLLMVPLTLAQTETIFARKLHVISPLSFSPEGVSWAKPFVWYHTSWNAEGNGLRIEVAQEEIPAGDEAQKARLLQVLPGANLRPVSVSGFSGWEGEAGQAAILGVATKSEFWIVLARGANALETTRTVCLERDVPAGWMPRVLPECGISVILPYDLAQRRDCPNYELHFDGFMVDYLPTPPQPDEQFDRKATLDKTIEDMKSNPAYQDLRVTRERFREFSDAEMVVARYKTSDMETQKIIIAGFVGETGFTLSWEFDPTRKDHREYSQRILRSLKPTKAPHIPGRRVTFGDTGLSLETRAPMRPVEDKENVREWVSNAGGVVVIVRFTPAQETFDTVDPSLAAKVYPSFVQAQMSQMDEIKGFKSETVPVVVSGVNGLLVKTEWENPGRNYRYGLFVGSVKGIYTVDVMAPNRHEVEQVIRSTQITFAEDLDTLKKFSFENSRVWVWNTPKAERISEKTDKRYDSVDSVYLVVPGELSLISSLCRVRDRAGEYVDLPATANEFVKDVASTLKGKLKVVNQDWGCDALGALYWVAYTVELDGQTLEGYLTAVMCDGDLLLQNAVYVSKAPETRAVGQFIMNSYRLTPLE